MRKQIDFLAKFDTSEFDRAVETMQRKLREVYRPMDNVGSQQKTAGRLEGMGFGGAMSKPTMEAFQRSQNQAKIDMNKVILAEVREQEKLSKLISARGEEIKRLRDQQAKIVEGTAEELKLKTQIAEKEKNQHALREQYKRNDTVLNQALDAREQMTRVSPAGPGGPAQGQFPPGQVGSGRPPTSGSMASSVVGGVALGLAALASGAAVVDRITGLPLDRNRSLGGATQNIMGKDLNSFASGNVVDMYAFAPERAKAMEMARKKADMSMKTDLAKAPGSAIGEAIGGLPVVGGVLKKFGVLGQGGGKETDLFWGGLADRLGDAIKGSAVASAVNKGVTKVTGVDFTKKLGKVSEDFTSNYQAKWLEEYSSNYQQMVDAEIQKNPLKKLAADSLQKNHLVDLQTQRMLGVGYTGFHARGGFLEQANQAGFTGDMAAQQARQIQASGGSTRAMNKSAVLGLQAERGFDMTNAGSVLGKISSGAGGSTETNMIFKKLLEEAVRNGLNKAESVEELRKWAEMTAGTLERSGVKTGEGAQALLESSRSFMQSGVIPTNQELAGNKSAYEKVQDASADASGRRGALQFAHAMKNGLAPLGADGIAGLMEMREDELTPENPYIVAMASKLGVSAQTMIEKTLRVKGGAEANAVGLDPAKQEMMRKRGLTGKTFTNVDELNKLKDSDPEAYEQYIKGQTSVSLGYTAGSPQERAALARRNTYGRGPQEKAIAGNEIQNNKEISPSDVVAGALRGAPTGDRNRIEDNVVKETGVAAQAMLENFRNFKDAITPANNAMDPFIKKLIILTQVMQSTPDKDKAATGKYALEQLEQVNKSMTQHQAGVPGGTPSE